MRLARTVAAAMAMGVCMALALACPAALASGQPAQGGSRTFPNGLPADPSFFPIAVWLQQPHNAAPFKAMGINTFIGLVFPPNAARLAQLERLGLHLIVQQTPEALALKTSPVIRGWLQMDEPDNAQPDGKGGYGDCVPAGEIVRRYHEIRARDATRPVYLNFGQAVANPLWWGRGVRCSAIPPSLYYKQASRGTDIVAFDIYPVAEARQHHVMGRLELVGQGVRNLKQWAPPGMPVWAAIETTHINNTARRPTPEEIRSEVWMAIVNGASGITYFVHEWHPSFQETGVLRYPDAVAGITRLNRQLQELAPVLNSPTVADAASIRADVEIAHMVKQDARATYVFAVSMENNKTAKARVSVARAAQGQASVLGEDRTIDVRGGAFEDAFAPYQVHIYRLGRE